MSKALFLYSTASGHGQVVKHHAKILEGLRKAFDVVDEAQTKSAEEGRQFAKDACGVYDALIVAGGDGTFYNVVNALAEMENTPILGYVNNGTIGDVGRNFGIGASYKKALKIIQDGFAVPFDICQTNENYFAYTAAIGIYADIPYVASRKQKKRFRRLSYYFLALRSVFKRYRIHASVEANGVTYEQDVPFVLLMNGRHMGGFLVNSYGNIFDGEFEIYLAKPGLFNGLLQYFFCRRKIKRIRTKEAIIRTTCNDPWDLDGEAGPSGELHVKVLPSRLQIFSAKGQNR